MDLLAWPARRLAGLVARILDVDGTPDERRAEVMSDITSAPADELDLSMRHMARAVTWGVLFAAVLPASLVLLLLVSLLTGEREGAVFRAVFVVSAVLAFFLMFMAGVHLVKMLVANELREGWWDLGNRWWRAAMLAQTPDVVVALGLAVVLAVSMA
ncbi:hypothetical protein K7640_04025 [Micromonospora sp. PLK6-60]|uniref:hypothetical protein n=1 Tax=Micromonospora sp. PLK6-60 TaxID=2873383 RepID=UPI001CA73B41|nr:hypothetical protein [Micromonospora sp. PLK6-60]MBY8871010.1 hypothetical protein [Micromonospora sp. PLK6-60]